jgi:peptide deformylase
MNDPKPETPVVEPKKHPLEILWYPDSRLTANNTPITEYTPEMADKVKEMFTLMYKTDGIGLAAPQIGWNVQLFVLNITPNDKSKERVYWNPKVFNTGSMINDVEGCLSFPTVNAKIKRYEHTEMTAQTPNGEVTEYFEGLGARAIQHEMDHLEGMLFIERMTPADQKKHAFILKQLRYRMAAIKK